MCYVRIFSLEYSIMLSLQNNIFTFISHTAHL